MIAIKSMTVRLGRAPFFQDAPSASVRDLEAADQQRLEAHGSLERQVV